MLLVAKCCPEHFYHTEGLAHVHACRKYWRCDGCRTPLCAGCILFHNCDTRGLDNVVP